MPTYKEPGGERYMGYKARKAASAIPKKKKGGKGLPAVMVAGKSDMPPKMARKMGKQGM